MKVTNNITGEQAVALPEQMLAKRQESIIQFLYTFCLNDRFPHPFIYLNLSIPSALIYLKPENVPFSGVVSRISRTRTAMVELIFIS